jgi:hypothetical protein
MNVIWIVADTFRRDHVGCYGNRVIRTPALEPGNGRSSKRPARRRPVLPARARVLEGAAQGPGDRLPSSRVHRLECYEAVQAHHAARKVEISR